MDNKIYQEAVKEAIKPAFGRKQVLLSKYTPQYPKNVERELRSVVEDYLKIVRRAVKENLPEIMEAYKRDQRKDSRYDGFFDLQNALSRIFLKIAEQLEKRFPAFDLRGKLEKIAAGSKNISFREWKRSVKRTLGIDMMDDYYGGAFSNDVVERWIAETTSLIQSIPQKNLGEMRSILEDGFREGKTISDIAEQIQHEYDVSAGKAKFLARDQIGTLNARLVRATQMDSGVTRYKWSTAFDNKVRPCHKSLNGHVFSWNDPPEMWTIKDGARVPTGRRCHPGEDYGCRCVAIPVFDKEDLDLPVEKLESNAKRGVPFPDFGIASIFTSQRKEG